MKRALKVFEWFWFAIAAIVGFGIGAESGNPGGGIGFMIGFIAGFWLPIAVLCEFGIAVLNHFEKVEQHNAWMQKNVWAMVSHSKMISDKLSKVTFE